jgi:hypothetical protein
MVCSEEVAVNPVRTQCCGALFCRGHIDDVRPALFFFFFFSRFFSLPCTSPTR